MVTDQPAGGLKRDAISAAGIVFLVLAAASPLVGLTGAVPSAMVVGNGLGVSLGYVAVGLVLLVFCVGFVAMSRRVTNAGALYAYVGRGLGLRTGLGAAGVAVWSYTAIQAAVYGFFGVVGGAALESWTGLRLPWWAVTLGLVVLVQVFGYLRIELGARVLGVLMALEWGIMLVLGLVILVRGGAGEGLGVSQVFSLEGALSGAPGVALVFGFASMFGFESSAIYGEEARSPKRTVARATYLSVLLITGFFLFMSWTLIVGYGPSGAVASAGAAVESGDPAAFVFGAGGTYLGAWAPHAMSAFVITSMFAATLAFHNGISRYLFTVGRDGVLPRRLSAVHPRTKAPYVASMTQTVSIVVLMAPFMLAGADPVATLFFWGSGVGVIGILGLYALSSVAAFWYFRANPEQDGRAWHTRVAPLLSVVTMVAALVLVLANFDTLAGGTGVTAVVLMLTVPVAFVLGFLAYGAVRGRLSPTATKDLTAELS
ncbi:APC family permease [Actinophytocola gossypii]|uniref:APC family permease n=1 Tax=Actinophytocola gossypii TaxID=2812003 RepID=A0ABT2J9L5_9PSEU|nr:APC family permease [Actinophytocola gossypii]MCT2584558.1 APC family permease [Actinophytocola gossypii]